MNRCDVPAVHIVIRKWGDALGCIGMPFDYVTNSEFPSHLSQQIGIPEVRSCVDLGDTSEKERSNDVISFMVIDNMGVQINT
jgi:hypothetical protein